MYTAAVCGLITNNLTTITEYMDVEYKRDNTNTTNNNANSDTSTPKTSLNTLLYTYFQMIAKLLGCNPNNTNTPNSNNPSSDPISIPSRRLLSDTMKALICWCKCDILWYICGQNPNNNNNTNNTTNMGPMGSSTNNYTGYNIKYTTSNTNTNTTSSSWFYYFIQSILPSIYTKLRPIRYSINQYGGSQDEEPIEDPMASVEFSNYQDYIEFTSGFKSHFRLLMGVLVLEVVYLIL